MGIKVVKLENRNHGSYQFETSYNGNVVFKANGTIHEVLPNKKIIRTFEMENMDLLYLTGQKVKSVLAIKTNFEKCQGKKEITP